MSTEHDARVALRRSVGAEEPQSVPAYAWPGGYPIGYVTDDGEMLCADCVNTRTEVHYAGDADGWRVDGFLAFGATTDYPDDDERCAHCNAVICEALS